MTLIPQLGSQAMLNVIKSEEDHHWKWDTVTHSVFICNGIVAPAGSGELKAGENPNKSSSDTSS